MTSNRPTNRLAHESSPYLLQHQHNPVNWQPWDAQALAEAKQENKPIFLSIGYAACHWCHVMERESFEDESIAEQLNQEFICIKVDREERPDLDQIYMNAILMLSGGRGGWPMSVFLTPDREPFFGGTYWPPRAKMGMPGFDQVVAGVSRAWKERQQDAVQQGKDLAAQLQTLASQFAAEQDHPIDEKLLQSAEAALERSFDFTHGGFGHAPKFPHAMDLQLLLHIWRRPKRVGPREGVLQMVRLNLDKMAQGGIYDHLGGGFARYSVDERWLVPHFEKMLYDNALLAAVYLQAFQATGDGYYAQIARQTLDYVLRDMTDQQGGFHSTEDADSEGEEGKFYVWSVDEIRQVLNDQKAEQFCYVYDVTESGNFEGKNILHQPKTLQQAASLKGWDFTTLQADLADSRHKLLQARNGRVRPAKDDKVLVSWNALMIDALAQAAAVLEEPRYLTAATRAAEFLLQNLRRPDGRLRHCWRQGKAKLDGYLDDYSYLANALVSLYEAGFEERWLEQGCALADQMLAHFADNSGGGFFFTADDHEQLIARHKDYQDSSVPSGNSMAALALFRLGALSGRSNYLEAARQTVASAMGILKRAPAAAGQMLIAVDWLIGPVREIVVVGDPNERKTAAALKGYRRRFLPRNVLVCCADPSQRSMILNDLLEGKQTGAPSPTVFICQQFTCQAPVIGSADIENAWTNLEFPGSNV